MEYLFIILAGKFDLHFAIAAVIVFGIVYKSVKYIKKSAEELTK